MNKTNTGVRVVEVSVKELDKFYGEGKLNTDYILETKSEFYPNECIVLKANGKQSGLGIVKGEEVIKIEDNITLYGLKPKNKEQVFGMALLKDNNIPLISFSGISGAGKTLLALAYAMDKFKKDEINSIIILKNPTPVGRDLGALPGTLLEKVRAWSGSVLDNMAVLGVEDYKLEEWINEEIRYKKRSTKKIEIMPFTYVQGRSINNSVIIVDEFQQASKEIAKQIVSRAGLNTKVILLGDEKQIFEKGLTETNNGLTHVIEKSRNWEHAAHIQFRKSERSVLCDWAWSNL